MNEDIMQRLTNSFMDGVNFTPLETDLLEFENSLKENGLKITSIKKEIKIKYGDYEQVNGAVVNELIDKLTNNRTEIDKDKLNDEFRMIISHAYLGYDRVNDMGLNEFNTMLDNLVKAVRKTIKREYK